ncbi:MAG: hypothetical protein MHPSP_004722 [Paramarteilia canceri]
MNQIDGIQMGKEEMDTDDEATAEADLTHQEVVNINLIHEVTVVQDPLNLQGQGVRQIIETTIQIVAKELKNSRKSAM